MEEIGPFTGVVNEFRRFAGISPSAFARTPQVQFLQDEGEQAA